MNHVSVYSDYGIGGICAGKREFQLNGKMEGVDLYSDLEDPFFFNDCPAQPPDQVAMATTSSLSSDSINYMPFFLHAGLRDKG